ncbi:MAG: hypothetical protein AAGC68_15205, partial [Verrucomicrobiota bacterium]
DGKADKSTVFAEGLDMPMGFALAHTLSKPSSVYLGEGPDLLLLSDTDGDDRADTREVLLTGFGTGDTHQNISNFAWGPDRKLYFSQGLHSYSRVETPWGIVRGDTAGFFRFDPATLKLEPFCFPSSCSQNPCGIVFGKHGSLFIKSNNRELIYANPGLVPTTRQKNLVPIASIGATPGKSMGGEHVDSPHLPDWVQDNILIAGYYSHRVSAFPLVKEGAGYARVEPVEVLFSEHGSFRPVEIRIGPDGAIYVADWYNPIIGHYQASLRHPDRDEEHGRIWRITAKGRDLQRPNRWPYGYHQLRSTEVEDRVPFLGSVPWSEKTAVFPFPYGGDGSEPRSILGAILFAANHGDAQAFADVLQALDHPRDRFIDYALEQTVFALAAEWLPAAAAGKLEFTKPEHLAYALETLGGEDALEIARLELAKEDLSREARVSFRKVLARSGNADDLLHLLQSNPEAEVIAEIERGAAIRKMLRPSPGFVPALRKWCESEDLVLRQEAIRLAGTWRVKPLAETVREVFEVSHRDPEFLAETARALARIEGSDSVDSLLGSFSGSGAIVKAANADALVPITPERNASAVVGELASVRTAEEAMPLIRPFLAQKDASAVLLDTWRKSPPGKESAGVVISALSRMGSQDEALLAFLQDAMGVVSGARAYSADFVNKL